MLASTIIIDVLLIAIVVVGIIIGIKRGLIKTLLKPVRFFASVLTAYWLAAPVARGIIVPIVGNPLTNQIKSYLLSNCPNITPESAAEELPTLLKVAAALLDVDLASFSTANIIDTLVDNLAGPVIFFLAVIVSFIIVYFIAKLVFHLLLTLVNSLFDTGLLSVPNKILGCVFNAFIAIVIAWLVTIIFEFVIHLPMFDGNEWARSFEGGFVYRFFCRTNPIDILLSF